MAKSTKIRELEQLEEDIARQAELVNKIQHESIAAGYSSRGREYEKKQAEAEFLLRKMNEKYQRTLNQATNLLKNIR